MSLATDIITYVGVPLAVLGVLPILYNTISTLVAVSRIRRLLSHNTSTAGAMTRSDVVNRVIEVELPRYNIAPLKRDDQRYWAVAAPSQLSGGSWTTFHWRTRVVGFRTLRVEYADQVRQPQSDVALDDLVSYLLDLGAVPDPAGWKILRSSGLWTPVGCTLMVAPDGMNRVLAVAPALDADGFLSLSVNWMPEWTTRNQTALPPYWMKLPAALKTHIVVVDEKTHEGPQDSPDHPDDHAQEKQQHAVHVHDEAVDSGTLAPTAPNNATSHRKASIDSVAAAGEILCHFTPDGLRTATLADAPSSSSPAPLYTEHLRVSPPRPTNDAVWFASAVTAFATANSTMLWNYRIPDDVLVFARKETIPCGIMVLSDMADESATPEWETTHDDALPSLEKYARRMREQRLAIEAEGRLPPAQRAQAQQDRMRRDNLERMDEARDRLRLENQRRETRALEALQSPRWLARTAAPHALKFLQSAAAPAEDRIQPYVPARDAAGEVLRSMVLSSETSRRVCRVLEVWNAWAQNGGMRKTDLELLLLDRAAFAWAILLVALIGAAADGPSSLSIDLQECLGLYRSVRLG